MEKGIEQRVRSSYCIAYATNRMKIRINKEGTSNRDAFLYFTRMI